MKCRGFEFQERMINEEGYVAGELAARRSVTSGADEGGSKL
jgi:hypothetical protein